MSLEDEDHRELKPCYQEDTDSDVSNDIFSERVSFTYKLLTSYLQVTYKLLTSYLQVTYKLLTSYSQVTYKLLTSYTFLRCSSSEL